LRAVETESTEFRFRHIRSGTLSSHDKPIAWSDLQQPQGDRIWRTGARRSLIISAVDRLVESALEAMRRRDWDRLLTILHPYIRWSAADGERLRGRRNVLAMLATSSVPAAPSDYELRDEQIYRWTEPRGRVDSKDVTA
jgi:hypothetical protein